MKVIKNINNNVSLCLTDSGIEVIALGKGLGFKKPPYELELCQVERTFYDVDETYINMIKEIPEKVLDISIRVIDYARGLINAPINSNVVFTLADHINFAIVRSKKNMAIKLPILYDVKCLMETEVKVGFKALEFIKAELKIYLPEEEAASIALHIANAECTEENQVKEKNDEKIIENVTKIIEDYFEISIDRSNFTYSRFTMHMRYLIRRGKENKLLQGDNGALLNSLSASLGEIEKCVHEIIQYLNRILNCKITTEERTYLIIYINRLCIREEDHV